MSTYKLTMTWPRGTKIVVTKELEHSIAASKWKTLCEELCGRNEHGEMFTTSKLENLSRVKIGSPLLA